MSVNMSTETTIRINDGDNLCFKYLNIYNSHDNYILFYVTFVRLFAREKTGLHAVPSFLYWLGLFGVEELQDLFRKLLRVLQVTHVAAAL